MYSNSGRYEHSKGGRRSGGYSRGSGGSRRYEEDDDEDFEYSQLRREYDAHQKGSGRSQGRHGQTRHDYSRDKRDVDHDRYDRRQGNDYRRDSYSNSRYRLNSGGDDAMNHAGLKDPHHGAHYNPAVRMRQSWFMYRFMKFRCGAFLALCILTIFPIILLLSPELLDQLVNDVMVILHPRDAPSSKQVIQEGGRAPGIPQNTTLLVENELDHEILIYNRAPKCASIWLTRLLYILGGGNQNHFTVQSPYEEGEKPFLTNDGQRSVVRAIENTDKPLVYIRHQYFIDFHEFNYKRPLYINMIRDPMKRFESFYYFIRFGNKEGDGADVAMSDARKFMSIDECVRAHDRECLEPKWQLVPYFCGHDPRCRQRGSWAVEHAKHNVEAHFVFVGIVEDLEGSLEVLEKLLPRYFKGARAIKHDESQIKNDTYTLNKRSPDERSVTYLKTQTSIALEYDLYNYIKQRYHETRKKLLLPSSGVKL